MYKLKYFLLCSMSFSSFSKTALKSTFLFHKPVTPNQKIYSELLSDETKQLIIVNGPAGTGKTLLACSKAIQDLQQSKIDKIVLTRPLITVEEEEMGFLPGNMVLKMDPWTKPIMDIFEMYYNPKALQEMIHNKVIEICPLGFMRGRTFKKCFILADEMQNSSPNQMLMLTTRLGENTKLVVMGDINQTDVKNTDNGFLDIINKYQDYKKFHVNSTLSIDYCLLDQTDILRSKVVTEVLNIYQFQKPFDLKSVSKTPLSFYSNKFKNSVNDPSELDAAMIPKKLL